MMMKGWLLNLTPRLNITVTTEFNCFRVLAFNLTCRVTLTAIGMNLRVSLWSAPEQLFVWSTLL